jgi:alpha- and gamma-adaptin-binding protein p34
MAAFGWMFGLVADDRGTEKVGIQRVIEALESNDWAAASLEPDDLEDDEDEDFGAFSQADADLELSRRKNRSAGDGLDGEDEEDYELDPTNLDFGFDKADFVGLRRAIWGGGRAEDDEAEAIIDGMAQGNSQSQPPSMFNAKATGEEKDAGAAKVPQPRPTPDPDEPDALDEEEVQKLDVMMRKLLAVRDMSTGLPDEQRKRMAARAVGQVMKEL